MGNVVPAEFFLFSQRMRRALYYDRFSLMDALHKIAFCTDTHGVESAEVLHFSRQNSLRAESVFIFGEPMGVYHYGENNV